ncbi:helix-turn-helix transcriptional regulator [Streptomyces sp. NBC_00306]|uniref:helix-turn-helix transcriptional regulator n=1 Tax=Streptomyces sp. NBC_00306 TaxID=2975708 RepID=UPI002E2E7BE6|nr:AAA family ATPase [Streptomyces sp. NBC_00306]
MGKFAIGSQGGLLGRNDQLAALDHVLATARAGNSAVVVLRGEAGIGKTALLDYATARAVGFRTVSVAGIESEMELPFATLQLVCAPMMGRLHELPEPQSEALSVAFGLREGTTPNRFLVGLAVLGLLASITEDHPLVCLIDDAQWIDEGSIEVLSFVARRLKAEPVALIFALRAPANRDLSGLPELMVKGLSEPDARALLAAAARVRLDPLVRDRIVAEARGNPMALLYLPQALAPAELAGGFWLPGIHPLTCYLESAFHQEFRSLPPDSQRLLQTAAAEPTGDVALLFRSTRLQDIPVDAAAPADAAGLVDFRTRVRFRHPLVRSAIYQRMSAEDRRTAHRALAQATDPHDPDRRAWHRARAAAWPDENIATDLEESAGRAQSRGGAAAAASFLRRSTEMTSDPARRVTRALAAAQAGIDAGGTDHIYDMLAAAEAGPLDALQRARLERLRASLVFSRIRGSAAPRLLLDAANRLAPLDPDLARETLLEAAGAVVFAGRLMEEPVRREVAAAARAELPPQTTRTVDVLLHSMASLIIDGYPASADALWHALRTVQQERKDGVLENSPWLWLGCPLTPEPFAPELWDDDAWCEMAAGAVDIARDAGALSVLPIALNYQACFHVHAGEFDLAESEIEEAKTISEATSSPPMLYTSLVLGAWRAQEPQTLELIESSLKEARERGEGRILGLAKYSTALLHNGTGQYDTALEAAKSACQYEDLGFFGWALIELIEAAVHSGQHQTAAAALEKLTDRTNASSTEWALGAQAYSHALLSTGQTADGLYQKAIEHLRRCKITVHLARAHLLYGEWLRRENRRQESRAHLHFAYDKFSSMGASGFADRAQRELKSTGENARKRTIGTDAKLTGQESQIARLVKAGHTNSEIADKLFISPRTVEWHLGNVFAKLGVTSRTQLSSALTPHT